MNATPESDAALESERSIAAVRWVLAFVGAALAVGSRAADGSDALVRAVGIAVIIAGITGLLSWMPGSLRRLRVAPKLVAIVVQLFDVAAAIGLVYLLSDVLPDASWAVLTIPIVLASLRLNALGVLWVWLVASLGYGALQRLELVGAAASPSLILERMAVLLAIAAGVALLTRFLHAGWMEQAQLASEAEGRLRSVQVIELAGREMRGRTHDEILVTCIHHVLGLGFKAASISAPDEPVRTVGDGSIVPADGVVEFVAVGVVELTEWHGPGGPVYSAATLEPRSGAVITGWTREAPGTLHAESLSELVAHASSGVELAGLMKQARYEADHDALTGLANRARFDRIFRSFTAREMTLAMLFIDLDHFKQINDTHGHATGDWALQQVGTILSDLVEGVAARYGGDEFVVVLAGQAAADAEQLAARVHEAVAAAAAKRSESENTTIDLSLSIGLAMAAGPVDSVELRRRADDAVFRAKDGGRSRTSTIWLSPTPDSVDSATVPSPPTRPVPPLTPPAIVASIPAVEPSPDTRADTLAGAPR